MRLSKIFILLTAILFLVVSVNAAMAQETTDPPKACWKKSYGRGAGTVPPNCNPDMDKDAGLCYQKCAAGFKGVGPVCWQICPTDYKDDGATCRKDVSIIKKDSYGRGVGKPMPCKGENTEKDAGLCYKPCNAGYDGKGPVCWKICPAGYKNDGATCRKDAHVFGKESKGRGVGTTPKVCDAGKLYDKGGLCYNACKAGYYGVGPVCWRTCTSSVKTKGNTVVPNNCGVACTSDKTTCSKLVGDMVAALVQGAAGGMSEDPEMVVEAGQKIPRVKNCVP